MSELSEAPPFGANAPTDGAASSVWTGTTNFDKTLNTLISLRLEEQLRNPLPWMQPGLFLPARYVKGTNGTMRFLAIGDLPVDVSDSSDIWVDIEGEPNGTEDLDFGYEEFTAKQAMFTVRITDVAALMSPFNLWAVAAEKVARRKMEIFNAVAAGTALASTNVIYAGDNANRAALDNSDVLTGADVREAVAILENSNVPRFPDGFYHGFMNPLVKFDFESDAQPGQWIDAHRYADPQALLSGVIGRFAGVQWYSAPTGTVIPTGGSGSDDVYSTLISGPNAFAIGDWGGGDTYFTPPGGHDDPGHQSALLTWIGYLGAATFGAMTNATGPVSDPRYIRIESGASLGA